MCHNFDGDHSKKAAAGASTAFGGNFDISEDVGKPEGKPMAKKKSKKKKSVAKKVNNVKTPVKKKGAAKKVKAVKTPEKESVNKGAAKKANVKTPVGPGMPRITGLHNKK